MKILLVILISAIVSAVVTKIITAKHLNVIDSYLDKTIKNVKSMVQEVINTQK